VICLKNKSLHFIALRQGTRLALSLFQASTTNKSVNAKTKKHEEEKEMKNGFNSAGAGFLRQSVNGKLKVLARSQALSNLKNKTRLAAGSSAPILGAMLFSLLLHEAARAQGGGPIFSGNANNLANIIREGLKLFAILLFCGGALGVGAAIWNKMWGKEWGNYAIGGGAAFAFGTIIAVIYAISQGQAVTVDTNF
jgi:hypothetical protein